MSSVFLVKSWIWISVLATVAGWILSALGRLDKTGYLAVGAAAAVGWIWWCFARERAGEWRRIRWTKLTWRFRHAVPFCFLALSLLVLFGGLLFAPANHTALSYRTPRVLNWLFEGHWHWIYTD